MSPGEVEVGATIDDASDAATDAAVELRGVSFSYNGGLVIEDASFVIPRGDFAGIVGPNGGGKTTLLKLMLGLLRPATGTIRLFGEPPRRAAHRVGYVPQGFQYDARLPVTVADVVRMGCLGHTHSAPANRAACSEEVRKALEAVALPHLESRRFADLSGGQRQRVLIARALTTQPEMLMLDEPTASLDAAAEREVLDLLRRLNERLTIVLVTHDLGFISSAVTSVLCVNRRVRRHPTTQIGDITGELLESLFGRDRVMVRHDLACQEGGGR